MAVVKRTLNEVVNKEVCDAIATANARPKSLPATPCSSARSSPSTMTAIRLIWAMSAK